MFRTIHQKKNAIDKNAAEALLQSSRWMKKLHVPVKRHSFLKSRLNI